jgi:inosose dehydratase
MPTRRSFVQIMGGIGGAALLGGTSVADLTVATTPAKLRYPISANAYNWFTFYGRDNRDWTADMDASLAEFAKSGIKAYEPGIDSIADARKLLPLLQKHGLSMPSAYVNSVLHEAEAGKKSINEVLAIADVIKPFGTKILVTNPTPLQWGGTADKSDAQLAIQAQNLDALGAALRARGMMLAYHNHDTELRAGAREFHHMLIGTNPKNVHFCLDVHWVYRGSSNSNIAIYDVLKLYGKRIIELHIRQSTNGIWNEVFGPGDIDYAYFAQELNRMGIKPHLVLEQCIEDGSPKTTNAVVAHQKGVAYLQQVFGV